MSIQDNNFAGIKQRFEKDAQAFNDIYSQDSGFNSWINRTFRRPIFDRFETAMQEMGDLQDKTVLDIGCGPGVYVVSTASQGAKHVLGIDLSAAMVEIAKNRVKERGIDKVCEFQNSNFLEMTFNQKFNFSIAMGVFDYLANPIPFLKKMAEVTTDKVIISLPGYSFIRGPLRQLRYFLTGKGSVCYYSREKVEKMAQEVGFKKYHIVPGKNGIGCILVAQP